MAWAGLGAPLLLVILLVATGAQADMQTIQTRPGLSVDVLSEAPESAGVLVLLFEGGKGLLLPGSKGFAHRAFPILLRHGIAAALMDAPTTSNGFRGGLHTGFRESTAHMSDIDAVVVALKQRYGLPVWVMGTSNGARSAAAYAIHRSEAIAGVVLVSSSTDPPFGEPIEALSGIGDVSVPILAISHLGDRCAGSPPGGAAEIARAAVGSPTAVAMLFAGGLNRGVASCGVETYHAFYGIEEEVVSTVVDFIARHTVPAP